MRGGKGNTGRSLDGEGINVFQNAMQYRDCIDRISRIILIIFYNEAIIAADIFTFMQIGATCRSSIGTERLIESKKKEAECRCKKQEFSHALVEWYFCNGNKRNLFRDSFILP